MQPLKPWPPGGALAALHGAWWTGLARRSGWL